MTIEWTAVYVMWLREMKRFFRSPSRIIGSLVVPLLMLGFFGVGFDRLQMVGVPSDVDYLNFLVPGIVGMVVLFSSVMSGMSVLWDKEIGFLKQILVAPVSRIAIVLGRMAGGSCVALFQGISILLLSMAFGFRPVSASGVLQAALFILFITVTFAGLGLVFASKMKDVQGFGLIMNFIIFPFIFLGGVFYPLGNLPEYARILSYADPLTYGIDGLRQAMTGSGVFPIWIDAAAAGGMALLTTLLGAWAFERTDAV